MNTTPHTPRATRLRARPRPRPQTGVILLVVLVALAALLTAGIALVRSSDVGLLQAGNLAFERDLQNQAERGVVSALAQFDTGGALAADADRTANQPAINYSAQRLATNVSGIPLALLSQNNFDQAGMKANDLVDTDTRVRVRTVIDRLCTQVGAYNPDTCTNSDPAVGAPPDPCISNDCIQRLGKERPVYRISVKATGPRNTQVFLQTTLSR